MKKKEFNIPLYHHKVIFLEIESKNDANLIGKELSKIKLTKEDVAQEIYNIQQGRYNGGITYRNFELKTFLVIIYTTTSKKQRLNIIGHEKRHIEDRLAENCNIQDIEALAYIAGFLTEKLFI